MKNVYKPMADSEKFLFHLYANLEDAALKEGNGELAKNWIGAAVSTAA